MTFDQYIADMPSGIMKLLFSIVSMFRNVCIKIPEYFNRTVQDAIADALEAINFPPADIDIVMDFIDSRWAPIYDLSIGQALVGGALLAVLIFGVIKFFTDIIL